MAVDIHRIMNITQNHAHVELSHRSAYSILACSVVNIIFSDTIIAVCRVSMIHILIELLIQNNCYSIL